MKNSIKKRKICFVITSFIHYSRNILVLEELRRRKNVELHILIGGPALLSKYTSRNSQVKELLLKEGFKNIHEIYFNLEGDVHVVKAKSTGLGIIEFANSFNDIKPDIVIIRGDRFEVLSAAIAAAYMNIPVAHIEGGDRTGTIDESVRHAITKISHIHFATNKPAFQRIIKMGEDKNYVFNFGSPDVEIVHKIANGKHKIDFEKVGSGAPFKLNEEFLMVMFHPVSSEVEHSARNTRILLKAVKNFDKPVLWFWPNIDAGAEEIAHELRVFKDKTQNHKIHFMRYIQPKEFIYLLRHTNCLIGNSSAGIKECSYLGIPVVNIGNRQGRRLRAKNVIDVDLEPQNIDKAIRHQLKVGSYKSSALYSGNNTARNIAKILSSIPLYIQKSFNG